MNANSDLKQALAPKVEGVESKSNVSAALPVVVVQAGPTTLRASNSERERALAASNAASQLQRHDPVVATKDSAGTDSASGQAFGTTDASAVTSAADPLSGHTAPIAPDGSSSPQAIAVSATVPIAHQGLSVLPVSTGQAAAIGAAGSTAATEMSQSGSSTHAMVSSEPHQTLLATPTSLEVGVHSGTQGWLKIRAEVGGQGEVSASLAATSSGGEQMLKGQLPALNAYLHSEQMSVTASVAERTGLAHGVIAHDAGSTSLQAGTGSASGQDASLLQGGHGQGAAANEGRSQTTGGSAVQVQPQPDARYEGRVETSATIHQPGAKDSSGQWLNVRV